MNGRAILVALGMALCLVRGAMAQGFNYHYDPFDEGYAQGAWNIEYHANGWLVYSASYEPDTISTDSVIGVYSILLFMINSDGELQWVRKHSVPEQSIGLGWANCCDSVQSGGGISAGSILNIQGSYRVRLMRYDSNGDTLWTRIFGNELNDLSGNSVRQTQDGGFLITGFSLSNNDADGFIIKTDSVGIENWMHVYGVTGENDAILSSAVLANGYILGGYVGPYFRVLRIDSSGQVVWNSTWGPNQYNAPAYVELMRDSTILVASAWGYSQDESNKAYYLAKLDLSDGDILWERQYGVPGYGQFFTVAKECQNTDLIAAGVTFEGGHEQGMLLRTTPDGDSLWMRRYWYYDTLVAQGQGRFWDVLPAEDGGCIATGYSGAPFEPPIPPSISQDAWVVKVDSMGCIVPGCDGVGITEQVTNLGDALRLWPNPVSGQLHVGFSLPGNFKTTGPLTLSVTTLDGRLVLRQQLPPLLGRGAGGEGILDVSALAPGTYALHLSDGTRWLAGEKFVVQ